MPKLIDPQGRTVSVSEKGREALLARGYTEPGGAVKAIVDASGDAVAAAESRNAGKFDVHTATKAELVEYAEQHGIDITKSAKVDEIRAQVKAGS